MLNMWTTLFITENKMHAINYLTKVVISFFLSLYELYAPEIISFFIVF